MSCKFGEKFEKHYVFCRLKSFFHWEVYSARTIYNYPEMMRQVVPGSAVGSEANIK